MIRLRLIGNMLALALVALACCGAARAGEPEPTLEVRLNKRVKSYSVSAPDMLRALTQAAGTFHIPMGVSWVDGPEARRPFEHSWTNTTVRKIMAEIARSRPGYDMRVRDGIVRVLKPGAIPDRENFLKLRIRAFEVHDELVDVASRRLRDITKVMVSPPPPPRRGATGGIIGSAVSTLEYPKVTLDMKNSTVEDILDALAVASPRKIWIVAFQDNSRLTPTGFLRTRSLWTEDPVPDREQPVWDMFHWGDKIPNP